MIKKFIALFFILLAGGVFLAHTAIPHHHHQEKIYRLRSADHACSGEYEHSSSDHKHNAIDTNDCFVLEQVFTLPSNQLKLDIKSFEVTYAPVAYDVFHTIHTGNSLISISTDGFSNLLQPLINSADPLFVNRKVGFRAPPFL
jgi:hypothetical protein